MADRGPSVSLVLLAEDKAVIDKCLRCHHLTASPLAGEVPALECKAPSWHCHVQGQKAKLREIYRRLIEEAT